MSGFRFRFDSVLKHRGTVRDTARAALADAQSARDAAAADLERAVRDRTGTADELRSLSAAGRLDIDALAARRLHAGRQSADLAAVHRSLAAAEAKLVAVRTALLTADRDVRALEKLRDRDRAAFAVRERRDAERALLEGWSGGGGASAP